MNKLLNYLPPYLQRYRELQHITDAEYPEIELVNNGIKLVLSEQFILSLDDYGCKRWENMLQIPVPAGSSLADRRATILMYINSDLPYTLRKLQMILDARYGKDMVIASTNKQYELILNIDNRVILGSRILASLVQPIIPANLVIKMLQEMTGTAAVYIGGKVSMVNMIYIQPTHDFTLNDFAISAESGGKVQMRNDIYIESEEI